MVEIGEKAPAFKLRSDTDEAVSSTSLDGQPCVIFFYPKDDTSGCTKEAIDFTGHRKAFESLYVSILGVSPDSVSSHQKFKKKHNLGIVLLADEEHALAEAFGVWIEKNMYGRKYMGIERSTFLVDSDGKIVEAWHKVKVPGHVEEVLAAARNLVAE